MGFFDKLVTNAPGGVFVVAEACDNHMGSLDMAKYLADAAKYAGADAVKFQHHIVNEEMLINNLSSDNFKEPLHEFLKRNSLTLNDHIYLKEYCDEIGILYLCTPFSYQAALEIRDLVPFYKIGSGEFQDFWYLDKLAELRKPVLFSCGMSTDDEILKWKLRYEGVFTEFAILNTLSEYPPKLADMNIGFIQELSNMFDEKVVVGHSDHTQTSFTSVLAVSMGARIIEKHLTLSHFVKGPDAQVSLDPSEFKELVDELRCVLLTCGKSKIVNERELPIRNWAYRSVVYNRDMVAGDTIRPQDIKSKRPGSGEILSADYEMVLGKVLIRSVSENTQVKRADFSL